MGDLRLPDPQKYRRWQKLIYALKFKVQTIEQRREVLRRACLVDRSFLAYLLGYNDDRFQWEEFHYWALNVRTPQLRAIPGCQSAWFCPRGTFKTALEEVDIVHQILSDPEKTIGIGSWKLDVSERILRMVRTNLEKPVMLWLFPDILYENPRREAEKWTENELIVRRKSATKDATLKAFSVETMPTSLHFDFMYLDDVVERRNAFTSDGIQKVKETLADIRSFRRIPGQSQIEVRGTLWHPDDWHHDLMKRPDWHVERHPAVVEDPAVWPDAVPAPLKKLKPGDLLFPHTKTYDVLEDDLREMGLWQYSGQVLMRLISDEKTAWTKEMVRNFFDFSKLRAPYSCYITVDLATSTGHDESAILVGVVTPDRQKYVVDGWSGHESPAFIADKLYAMHKEWGGRVIIEEISGFQYFEDILNHAAKKHGFNLPRTRVKHRQNSKWERIWGIDGEMREKRIHIPDPATVTDPEFSRFLTEYERQALTFPRNEMKDILDCMADFVHFGMPPSDVPNTEGLSNRDMGRVFSVNRGKSLFKKIPFMRKASHG